MFKHVVEAADRRAATVRKYDSPADDDALLAGMRAAVAARNAADGLLARLTGEIECRGTAKRLGMSEHGWEIVMGPDRHPWIRPPASVDPRRGLQPAYNRGTLRLDTIAA